MTRKKFNPFTAENVEVVDISLDGRGIGRSDGKTVFIKKAVPGDFVNVNIKHKKKNLFEGEIHSFIKSSPYRTEPFCKHFNTCGGCKLQHITYREQLSYKQKHIKDSLERIAGIDTDGLINPISASAQTRFYRNKLEFTFSNKRWISEIDKDNEILPNALGFHAPLRFDKVVDIEYCYLQDPVNNDIRNEARKYALENNLSFYDIKNHKGLLRNLIIRTTSTGELMVIVVFAENKAEVIKDFMKNLSEKFESINSLLYIVNQKHNDTVFDQEVRVFSGKDYIMESMHGLSFKISPKSFFQTNTLQAAELYKVVRDFAQIKGSEIVYDLYTGTGTIANFIAKEAKKVIGIDYITEAIEDARINALINGIDNTLFIAGDIKDTFNTDFILEHGRADIIITDPPRSGMHPDAIKHICSVKPEKIIYISCNPATQARDLVMFKDYYSIKNIRPVDMFPHTVHVENVILLNKI